MPARVNTHQNLEKKKRKHGLRWAGDRCHHEHRDSVHQAPDPPLTTSCLRLSPLKYDALLTADCDGLSIHSLFIITITLKFKANNNLCEICFGKKKNNNHNNYIHSGISKENITECVERQKLVVLVNQVNLKITL